MVFLVKEKIGKIKKGANQIQCTLKFQQPNTHTIIEYDTNINNKGIEYRLTSESKQ